MYITYGKMFGGLRTLLCFGYFLKMEAFRSELLTGQLVVSENPIKILHYPKNIYINYHFRHVPKLSIGFPLEVLYYYIAITWRFSPKRPQRYGISYVLS